MLQFVMPPLPEGLRTLPVYQLLNTLSISLAADRGSEPLDDVDATEVGCLFYLEAFLRIVQTLIYEVEEYADGRSTAPDYVIAALTIALHGSVHDALNLFNAFNPFTREVKLRYNWADVFNEVPRCSREHCTLPGLTGQGSADDPYLCPMHMQQQLDLIAAINTGEEDPGDASERV